MKKISLQWRITLMTAILIGITCVSMNSLIGYSGRHYMDSIGSDISANSDSYKGEQEFFDPESADLDQEVTIIVNGAQESFSTTNWCITAVVTLLGGVLAYFVSGRALKPLHTFASRVENVQPNNLTDMKITDDVPAEFKQFSISFNQMLDRLDEGFTAQRQFTGNAAHQIAAGHMALGPVVRDLLFGLAHDAAYPAGVRGIHGTVALAAYDGAQRGLARGEVELLQQETCHTGRIIVQHPGHTGGTCAAFQLCTGLRRQLTDLGFHCGIFVLIAVYPLVQ